MAKAKSSSLKAVEFASEKQLPWRRFKDRPTNIWIEETVRQIKETGYPEWVDSLNRNRIPKNSAFFILKSEVSVDIRKRSGDLCPCPMCTPNRFKTGSLVWFRDLECCGFIGNCCADHDVLARATNELKWRTRRDSEDDYLLATLPLVTRKMEILEQLKPVALEALRTFRHIRKAIPQVHAELRRMKRHHDAKLVLTEVLSDDEDDDRKNYIGPAAFGRGKRGVETRDHVFGTFVGQTAVLTDYNPVKELATLLRQIDSIHVEGVATEEDALEFICRMSDAEKRAAVAVLRDLVDPGVVKFADRLKDLAAFFCRENGEMFHAFFTSPLNTVYFSVEYEVVRGSKRLVFSRGSSRENRHIITLPSWPAKLDFRWPTAD